MKKGGVGGANTNASGLPYEAKVAQEIRNTFLANGFQEVQAQKNPTKRQIFRNSNYEFQLLLHNAFYTEFIEELGINFKQKFSARLIPDIALVDKANSRVKIIEIKNQTGSGSVVEKLQTCDYKQYYYSKLLNEFNYEVQVMWRLGKFFEENSKSLASVYEYMILKNSPYFFSDIPITNLLK